MAWRPRVSSIYLQVVTPWFWQSYVLISLECFCPSQQVLIIFWICFDGYILFQQSWLHTGNFSPLEDSSLIYLDEVKFLTSLSSLGFILAASIIKGQFLVIWVKTIIVFWIVLSRICVCILQKIFLGVFKLCEVKSYFQHTPLMSTLLS